MIKQKTIKSMLTTYIIIGFVTLLTIILIFMNVVSIYMKKEIKDKGEKIIEVLSNSINASLSQPINDLHNIKSILEDNNISAEPEHILKKFAEDRDYFILIQLADLKGTVTNIVPHNDEFVGIDVSKQEYFIHTINNDDLYWSSSTLSALLEKPLVSISLKTQYGILTAFILPETILSNIQQLVNQSKSFITVTDRKGVFIVHPNDEYVHQRINDKLFSEIKHQSQGGILEISKTVDQKEMLISVESIDHLDWMIKVHQSLDVALKPVKNTLLLLGIFSFFIILIFLYIASKLLLPISKTFESIIGSTVLLGEGKYDAKVSETNYADLNSLISSFNLMADSLSKREIQLKSLNTDLKIQIDRVTHAEQTFKTLIESTTGRFGQEYLDNLVTEIAGWFSVETVMVSLFDINTGYAETASMSHNGELMPTYKYPILGSPCEEVAQKGFLHIPNNVAEQFPNDPDLVEFDSQAYVGTPLTTIDGDVIGVLCAISMQPLELPEWGKDLLQIIASATVVELQRMKAEEKINNSLKEKEIMLKEIHHRVKNNLQVITGFLSLQQYNSSEEVAQLLSESINRVHVMALLHQQLYQSKDLSMIELKAYVSSLINNILISSGRDDLQLEVKIEDIRIDIDNIIPLGLIINELISNALKHAFEQTKTPQINVVIEKKNGQTILSVTDNGKGFPDNFSLESSDTLGLSLVESLSTSLKGSLTIQNNQPGSIVKITISDINSTQ